MTHDENTHDLIRYDLLVQDALRSVVKTVLTDAAQNGLPGNHHFFITFRTDMPGVKIADHVRAKHPEEITIALQHQFWDMRVGDNFFEVGLSFGGVPERLYVPFDALTGFWDPSVDFGLKFEMAMDSEPDNDEDTLHGPSKDGADKDAHKDVDADRTAAVVSLDAFRKKT